MAASAAATQSSRARRRFPSTMCIRYRTVNHTVAYGSREVPVPEVPEVPLLWTGDAVGYDVIVVGARVAGAATALLLARRGLRVLAADRASFPSDTLSSHQIQPPGVARLARWGLLDRLGDAPATPRVLFDSPAAVLDGTFPGGGAIHSPRRTVLDHAL